VADGCAECTYCTAAITYVAARPASLGWHGAIADKAVVTMFRLALRNLFHDPRRTVLTTAALAAVIGVILLLEGFRQGFIVQGRVLALERGADLIVTQAGITNMFGARSILPQFARRDVEAVDGVAIAHPLTAIMDIYGEGARRMPIFLLVYDTGGGPSHLVAGTMPESARDIVIDRSIAKRHGLSPGDPFVLSDFEFRVAGITSRAATVLTPFGYLPFDGLLDFYFESDLATDISTFPLLSYLLVELEPGADRRAVSERIAAAVPAGAVFHPEELADNDARLVEAMFGPIFALLITVGYLTGVLVTAIIMFAAVLARRRSFGVLKALGFRTAFLGATVIVEAVILVVLAIPAGMLIAAGISSVIEATMPLYLVLPLEPASVIRTAAASLAFALLGALAPLPLVRRVDPALAFRS
jgi:putative ABC transport system permease protein